MGLFGRSESEIRRDMAMEKALSEAGAFFAGLNRGPLLPLIEAIPQLLREHGGAKGSPLAEGIGQVVSAAGSMLRDRNSRRNGAEETEEVEAEARR